MNLTQSAPLTSKDASIEQPADLISALSKPEANPYLLAYGMAAQRPLANQLQGNLLNNPNPQDTLKKLRVDDTVPNMLATQTSGTSLTLKDRIITPDAILRSLELSKLSRANLYGKSYVTPENMAQILSYVVNQNPNPQMALLNIMGAGLQSYFSSQLYQQQLATMNALALKKNLSPQPGVQTKVEASDKAMSIEKTPIASNFGMFPSLGPLQGLQNLLRPNLPQFSQETKALNGENLLGEDISRRLKSEDAQVRIKYEFLETNNEQPGQKRRFKDQAEGTHDQEEDYHHMYSGRLRNKPGQKFYYKQLKKTANKVNADVQATSFGGETLSYSSRSVECSTKETQTSPIDASAMEKEEFREIVIHEKYQKRDYTDYVMNIHVEEDNQSEIKLTPVGSLYQAEIPPLITKEDKQQSKKANNTKCVWNPDEVDEITLYDYLGSLDEYVGADITNEERAIKLFKKFKMSKAKVLESIRKNRAYYLSFLGLDYKKDKTETL